MDLATVVGFFLAVVAILGSILAGGDLGTFIDVPSLLVVVFGVIAATCIKWPVEYVKLIPAYFMKTIFATPVDPKAMIEEIQKLAETARRESVFALEKVPVDDFFLKKAVVLAADNRPPEVIQSILKLDMDAMESRHKIGIAVFAGMGNDGPAFGMIGTLIGLVQMLKNLSDPSAIGPAMAIALLTTFYGSIIANAVALPVSAKLETRSMQEMMKMNIIVAGTLGIVAGENPRVIREKLDSFLPPNERAAADGGDQGGE